MFRLAISLVIAAALGVLYSYLYYGIAVRGRLAVPLLAGVFLVVLPAIAAWMHSRQRWLDLPLSVGVACAAAFFAAVVVWKDGL
jgi:hypothetical protein